MQLTIDTEGVPSALAPVLRRVRLLLILGLARQVRSLKREQLNLVNFTRSLLNLCVS